MGSSPILRQERSVLASTSRLFRDLSRPFPFSRSDHRRGTHVYGHAHPPKDRPNTTKDPYGPTDKHPFFSVTQKLRFWLFLSVSANCDEYSSSLDCSFEGNDVRGKLELIPSCSICLHSALSLQALDLARPTCLVHIMAQRPKLAGLTRSGLGYRKCSLCLAPFNQCSSNVA